MHSQEPDLSPATETGTHLSALDDMEAIFGRPEPGRRAAPAANLPALRPRRRRAPAVLIAGLVAVIALALVFLVRTPGTSQTRAAEPARRVAAVPQMGTEQALLASLQQERAAAEAARREEAEAAQAREAAARSAPPVAPSPAPTAEVASIDTRPPERTLPAAARNYDRVESPVFADRRSDAAAAYGPRPGYRCTRNDDRPECVQTALRAADYALRRAYYAAQAAGVDVRALRHYRREWNRVRDYAIDDPEGTIDNYRGMARDLTDLASDRDAS